MKCQTLLFVAVTSLIAIGCGRPATQTEPSVEDAPVTGESGPVTIAVMTESGPVTTTVEEVADGTTLAEVMRAAKDLDSVITGSGKMSFVQSLLGRETSSDSGWTFRVDGEFSKQGIGSVELHPPTEVSWKFGGWEE